MDKRYKHPHVFVTKGDQKSGIYTGTLIDTTSNTEVVIEPAKHNHKNGLQEMRRKCAAYLKCKGYSNDYVIQHHCIKPGRTESKNPLEEWSIYELEKKTKKDTGR